MLCALIMAGGRGTRFWPMSTESKPKQFLSLIEDKTMLQLTVERCLKIMPIENVFVCTSEKYCSIVENQIIDLPKENIILEPVGRNTAPCVLLSSIYIKQIYTDANIIVLPSDHEINDLQSYLNILNTANQYLMENKTGIITLGIKPDYPETGYGYIKYKESENFIKEVDCFVEKPDLDTAKEYLEDGKFLWNAGMFMFNVNYLLNIAESFMKDSFTKLNSLPNYKNECYYPTLMDVYPLCESISFDYAIAEKCKEMLVIESDIDWDDIGSWKALERYLKEDENENISKGDQYFINSNRNIAYTNKKVIFEDVDDLLCVESDDFIIVTKKENIEKVHKLKECI